MENSSYSPIIAIERVKDSAKSHSIKDGNEIFFFIEEKPWLHKNRRYWGCFVESTPERITALKNNGRFYILDGIFYAKQNQL